MGNLIVSWMGFSGDSELENCMQVSRRDSCKDVRICSVRSPPWKQLQLRPQPTVQHTIELGWLLRVIQDCNQGARFLCSSISQSLTMRHPLEGGITLAKAVSYSQGQFSVRDAAVSCQSWCPWLWRWDRLPWRKYLAEHQSRHYTYGITARSVTWKSGDVCLGPGAAKTVHS